MKKDKTILIVLLIFLVFLAGAFLFFGVSKEEEKIKETDTMKLKNEYENLNGKINEKTKREYPTVNVNDNISFKIANESEVIDLLTNKTGIVFLGSSLETFSRTLFQTFNKVLEQMPIDNIYYLDILAIKDELGLDDRDEPIIKKEGSAGYYQMVEILKEYLPNNKLLNKNNEYIETKQKEIVCPTIIAVLNGNIVGIHSKTVDTQKNGYDLLTNEEEQELEKIIKDLITKINENN